MTVQGEYQVAAAELVEKLCRLNLVETGCGLFALEDADRTWNFWLTELQARVTMMTILQEPTPDVLDTLGALVLAMKVRLGRQQEVQIHTGSEAA